MVKSRIIRWLLCHEPIVTAAVVLLLALAVCGAADPLL